ncbi:hypothetical protein Tco_0454003 [Tanacetum coccineum]
MEANNSINRSASKAAIQGISDVVEATTILVRFSMAIRHKKIDLETGQMMIKNPPLGTTGVQRGKRKNMQTIDVVEAPATLGVLKQVSMDEQPEEEGPHLPNWRLTTVLYKFKRRRLPQTRIQDIEDYAAYSRYVIFAQVQANPEIDDNLILKALEDNFSELRQTNQYAEALSSIPSIVDQYLAKQCREAMDVADPLKSDRIREESTTCKSTILDSIDGRNEENYHRKKSKQEVSKIISKIEKLVIPLTRSLRYSKAAYKALVDAYEADKILLDTYGDIGHIKRLETVARCVQEPPLGTDGGLQKKKDSSRKSASQLLGFRGNYVNYSMSLNQYCTQEFEQVSDKQAEEEIHLEKGMTLIHHYSDPKRIHLREERQEVLEWVFATALWSHVTANARAMIQAIDKRLKTRRIMRSLERFVGGRPYGGDLRLLQRTI